MKKVLALVLAVVLAFGMATTAFAATPKITGIGSVALGESGTVEIKDQRGGDLGSLEAKRETEIRIYLTTDNFNWDQDDTEVAKIIKITSGMLSNVDVKKSVSKGSDVIRDIEVKHDSTKGAYIRIRFVEWFVSTGDKDFDFKVYLSYKSTRSKESEIQITGTMANPKEYISDGDDYYDLSDGVIAEAEDYIKRIEFEIGDGISIITKAFDGKKYYGIAIQDITASDDAVVAKYPEIDTIYTLRTVNLRGSGNIVKFDIDDRYYVYNSEGKYVGTTAEMLPYSDKYYLATKKIDMVMGDSAVEEPGEEPGEEPSAGQTPSNPPMGGDDGAPNANDNPGTGAGGFVNVAVALGLVSLAAVAVSKKK